MDDINKINSLNRKAIIYDAVCILIAGIVLYFANAQKLPFWALVLGALLAAAFLCAGIWCLMRARKLLRQMETGPSPQKEEKEDNVSPNSSTSL